MKIGMSLGGSPRDTCDSLVATAQKFEEMGFSSLWMAHIFGLEAMTALAIVGRETKSIELGTAVVPVYRSHPMAMAQQALSTNAAAGGRFTLGIGLTHKPVVEDMWGLSYDKPARYMREYLEVMGPLMAGEPANYQGEIFKVAGALEVAAAPKPSPFLVAALGPLMLKIAGEKSGGTITWMTGKKTIEGHIAPIMNKAASGAGKPTPRIVAGFPFVLTADPDGTRDFIAKNLTVYGQLASYRAMLDKEGLGGPADIAIVGGEQDLDAEMDRLAACGITDFNPVIISPNPEDQERTLQYLASRT